MNPTLHVACAANRTGADKRACLFAEHIAPFLSTPFFALQARYDTWQIANELGTNATVAVRTYGDALMTRLNSTLLANPKNAAFVDSCAHHCGAYDSIEVNGINAANAFYRWYLLALFNL